MERGTINLVRVAGVSLRVHWSVLAVALACLVAPRIVPRLLRVVVAPMSIVLLGYLCIVVAHELGHAVAARCFGLEVHSLTLTAVGGSCGHEDGYLLWKVAVGWWKGEPFAYPDTSRTFPPDTRLTLLKGFAPEHFTSGIEILNDNTTPLVFVAAALEKHLGLPREEAFRLVVATHMNGGILIPLPPARAQALADAIAHESEAAGHALACRVAVASDPA